MLLANIKECELYTQCIRAASPSRGEEATALLEAGVGQMGTCTDRYGGGGEPALPWPLPMVVHGVMGHCCCCCYCTGGASRAVRAWCFHRELVMRQIGAMLFVSKGVGVTWQWAVRVVSGEYGREVTGNLPSCVSSSDAVAPRLQTGVVVLFGHCCL